MWRSLLAVKNSISACYYNRKTDEGFEAITAKVNLHKHGITNFTAIYNAPGNQLTDNHIKELLPSNQKSILAGDLNAKNTAWGCNATNRNERNLKKAIENENLYIHIPDRPTYYPSFTDRRPDILDIAIMNFKINCSTNTVTELLSDHLPVLMYITGAAYDNTKIINSYNQ